MEGRGMSGRGSDSFRIGKGGNIDRLKRLDIYARPKREFQHATVHGAVVSCVAAVAVTLLFWRELQFSLQTETVEQLFVNSTINPMLNISFDVVFPRISCSMISIDAEDSTGIPQPDVEHHLVKIRLDAKGEPLDKGQKHELGNTLNTVKDLVGEEGLGQLEQKDKGGQGSQYSHSESTGAGRCVQRRAFP
ncbi:unnamed protein product [Discosporangium mesarthrocarpum]